MDMNMGYSQPFAPAVHDVLDTATTDPLVALRQEQRWVAVLGPVLFDVLAEGLQGCWANHELASLASLANDLACAEVLGCSVGRLAFPRHNAVLIQLAEFRKSETGVHEQQDDRLVADIRNAVNQIGKGIVLDGPGCLIVDPGPLHPLDRVGDVAFRVVAEELVVGRQHRKPTRHRSRRKSASVFAGKVVDELCNRAWLCLCHTQALSTNELLVLLEILPIGAQSLYAAGLAGQILQI